LEGLLQNFSIFNGVSPSSFSPSVSGEVRTANNEHQFKNNSALCSTGSGSYRFPFFQCHCYVVVQKNIFPVFYQQPNRSPQIKTKQHRFAVEKPSMDRLDLGEV